MFCQRDKGVNGEIISIEKIEGTMSPMCYKFILIFNGRLPKYDFIEVAACMWHSISN